MNYLKFIIISIFCAHFCFAEEKIESQQGPCKQILDACKKYIADHTDKSLYKDCMQPILGEKNLTIPGLNIDPSFIDSCKKKKNQLKQTE